MCVYISLEGHPLYLVFVPLPGTELIKPLEFPGKRMRKVSFVMLMRGLSQERLEVGCQGNQPPDERVEVFSLAP